MVASLPLPPLSLDIPLDRGRGYINPTVERNRISLVRPHKGIETLARAKSKDEATSPGQSSTSL
jgi:hypothetical protein